MTEVRLQRARIGALVRQDQRGGVAQHVRMHLEADLGRVARATFCASLPGEGPSSRGAR